MPPHPLDGYSSYEKGKSPRPNTGACNSSSKSRPSNGDSRGASSFHSNNMSSHASNRSHPTATPQMETIDALQFDGPMSPVDDSQFGGHFGNSSPPADDSEESTFSRRVTDDNRSRDDEASLHETDWTRFACTITMCTEDELKGGVASIPLRQSFSGIQEYDGIQFQGGASPLHRDDGFFTPDHSARDADDLFLNPIPVVGPSSTVNHDVLEALEAFRTAGDSAPADYQGATIGATAAASLTNVANSSMQLSTNESPINYSAAYNYNMQLPCAGFNVARTSEETSLNTSLMQQQYTQPQQQASWNCNSMYLKSDQWNDVSLPLVQWMEIEKMRAPQDHKASVLRKLNVAYGIGKLLQSSRPAQESCSAENFIVRESSHPCNSTHINNTGWEVVGIRMINPAVAVQLISTASGNIPAVSSTPAPGSVNDAREGRVVLADIDSPFSERQTGFESDEMQLCCALGELLHFLFSEDRAHRKELGEGTDMEDMDTKQPAKRQSRDASFSQASINSNHDADCSFPTEPRSSRKLRPLLDYGYPASISQLVQDLLTCGDGIFRPDSAFKSLKDMTDEVHLLFEEPTLLFERTYQAKQHLSIGGRLFGRSTDTAKIVDAFHRVASTRMSEVVMIGGHSGSGKTALVQRAIESVKLTGGYFVIRKFEEISTQSCINVVVSAFDDIAIQLARSKPIEHLNMIYMNLMSELGLNFQFLARVLPSVLLFISPNASHPMNTELDANMNFMSLCFLLQRFMKVISACSGFGMLFLDDLQWADQTSLRLVHTMLAGNEDSTSLLLVGSYRNNDAQIGQLLPDFLGSLSRLNASLTTIHLDGIPENGVNLMISDALGIVPRLCGSLSSVVYRKTRGNPFHVGEFLRTLVDKELVTYSLRQKRWLWDVDKVGDVPVTDNVLVLITAKMNSLPNDAQIALKVASCFGIKILASVIKSLSEAEKYSTLQVDIDNAVREGFIDFDGKHYKFAHDKVREASYELIDDAERKSFHFEIGMALYSSCVSHDSNDNLLFTTVEQINYGVPSLLSDELQRVSVAKLNYIAGLTSMKRWDFGGSFRYMQAALSLLSADSWRTHYDFVLNLHYQLAKAAYPCGAIEVAKFVLNEIDKRGKCLEDKLDAYDLLVRMLQHHQDDLSLALDTCCKTLKLLGEDVPFDEEISAVTQIIELGRTRINTSFISSSEMLNMPRTTCKQSTEIMRFYYQLVLVSFTKGDREVGRARGLLCGYYISRWVSYCLNQKAICKHTPVALGFYSGMLVHGFGERNCREALSFGKIALQFLNENEDENELPSTYLPIYGFVLCLSEPIQACVEMHRRAYEVGMQIGNVSDAFSNLYFMIPRMIDAGEKLDVVKKQIDFFQQLAKTHSHPVLATYMQWYQDTITGLCDSKASPAASPANADECKITDATSIHIIQLCLPAVYLGQYERVQFLMKKWDSLQFDEKNRMPWRTILISYYNGLAFAGLHRRKKNIRSRLGCLENSISVLDKASNFSEWNFKAKLSLLTAEKLSIKGKYEEAEAQYDTSIKAAQASRLIHEEALACELSARHYFEKNDGRDFEKARSLYTQAKKCYEEWGSPKKVMQVEEAIQKLIVNEGKRPTC